MEKPDSTSGSDVFNVYRTVFIDTSLDTHLAMIVSDSDTVSDLKKKIMYEHPLCFPNIGQININALKVRRKGYLYHLSDSMFVKSAFVGVSKSWFLSVDASSAEEHREDHNSLKPDTGKVLPCFDITINNSSADVVYLLPGDTSKRLSNINDQSLPQDEGNCLAKQNSVSQQFGFSNSTKENSKDLAMEAEHTADSNPNVIATGKESRPKVQLKDVTDDKIYQELPSSVAASVLKEKHKTKNRDKDAIHDNDVKENGALAVESGKDACDSRNVLKENSFQNGLIVVLSDMNTENQTRVDETRKSLSSDRNKKPATIKRMADEETQVPGEHSECKTNKHKDFSLSEQAHNTTENSSQSGPPLKKKRTAKKKDGDDSSLIENGALIYDFLKQGTGPDTTTFKSSLEKKLESTSAILDHLNTESVKENHLLTANASGGRKKRKKQKSNPSQVGSEISSGKDVHVDSFQATAAGFPMGEAVSEPCLISSTKVQEVSKTNRVPISGGNVDMADTNDGNTESQNEAPEPDVVSVIQTRDSIDQNASHVDGHSKLMSINLPDDSGVSGHLNQSGTLAGKIVEPKKSSRRKKKSKKTKDPVGGTEAVDPVHDRGPASDVSPSECPTHMNCNHISDNAEQCGTTDGKEESKMKTPDCLPSVTNVRADEVIRDVLESLPQCNNGPANEEKTHKKSRKKAKKQSSAVVDSPALQGKIDVDHQDPTVLADNVSELSASSKSTRKTVKAISSSAVQLNVSDLGSTDNTVVGISSVHTQRGSSQNTIKSIHDGKPIQGVIDVDHSKSACIGNANNSIEVPSESERVKSQHWHEIVNSGEIVTDKVTEKKGVETEVKGKRKQQPEVQSGGSRPNLSSSKMLNGNQRKEAKPQAAKSSSIQSQRSSSKVEPYGINVQSSNPLLTVSEGAVKKPLQSKKSDEINSIHEDAIRPIINSSGAHTNLEKNIVRAVPSSTLERSENTINLSKGGKEQQSYLGTSKTTGSNNGKVVNSLANKKSLLVIGGTIFNNNDKESSDDEDGEENSDASTRTPSDSSSSSSDYSEDSHMNGTSLQNGSDNLEGEEAGEINRQKPGYSSQKSMSLHAILRNSSSYKKAKLTASQDLDSQPDEFVPVSQAK
ncbi:hypothetical protein DITRI_Ditri12bG0054400 [Diplodiscus trichospermus]